MNIEPIPQVTSGVTPRLLAEQIDQVKQANQDAVLRSRTSTGGDVGAPNIITSQAYSPSVIAQAAQFQLYTQAGLLITMAGGALSGVRSSPKPDHPIGINRIEKLSGTSLDTRT